MTVATSTDAAPLPRRHRRRALVLLGPAGAAGAAVLLSLRIGSVPLDTHTVLSALLARGRFPHQRVFRYWSPEDAQAMAEALADTAMEALRDGPVDELSGGQRQRAFGIARRVIPDPVTGTPLVVPVRSAEPDQPLPRARRA